MSEEGKCTDKATEQDVSSDAVPVKDTEDRAMYRACMQTRIVEVRQIREDQILLNKRLADANRVIDEYGYALFGGDYHSDNVCPDTGFSLKVSLGKYVAEICYACDAGNPDDCQWLPGGCEQTEGLITLLTKS